jgi:glycosyltransferase XagB
LTRWFTNEYTLWFDLTLPGLQQLRSALPLGGTSNHFRVETLRHVGAWDPYNVTEDCDLGLRLAQHRLRTVVLDSTTMEEANSNTRNWIRQRSRWIKGYFQTYLVHMRRPWSYLRKGRMRDFFTLQVVVGARSLTLLINPLMWLLLAAYLIFNSRVVGVYHMLYPTPVFYMGMISLVFGNVLYMYTYLIAGARRRNAGMMKWALLIPIYWAMMSVAAGMALWQLIIRPHYWEKTQHGLHLQSMHTAVSVMDLGLPATITSDASQE